MGKGKDFLVGGLLCASITFAGYSHTQASQRFNDVDSELGQAQASVQESRGELDRLTKQIETLRAELKEESRLRKAGQKELTKAVALPPIAVSSQPEPPKAYKDVEGVYAQKTIENLLTAGIVELGDGEFRPDQAITRGEFLQWLVKSTNHQLPRDRQVRLARGGEATFNDVPPDHPAFPYVQGAVNSGFVVGYDETTFRPDRELSREELIAIKVSFDKAEPRMNGNCNPRYTDFDQVAPKYKQAVHNCDNGGYGSQTAAHIWGNIKTFRPKQSVTRAEAALCVERIKGDYNKYQIVGAK